jgi:hypothetical protein
MKSLRNDDPIERQAVRVMFILYYCHDMAQDQFSFIDDFAFAIGSETKVQKIDFWIRYPDYLASALIRGCTEDGKFELSARADEIKGIVRSIFQNQEPTLRWVPMHKYLRGAYESLDDVTSFLSSLNFVYRRTNQHQTRYFMTRKGSNIVKQMLDECSEVLWYSERCQIISSFWGHLNGVHLRELQYLEREYMDTPNFEIIARNEAQVRQNFRYVFGEEL